MRSALHLSRKTRRMIAENAKKEFAIALLITAIAGVITGIMLAPKSGKGTRKDMKTKLEKATKNIEKTFEKGTEAVKDFAAQTSKEIHGDIKDAQKKAHEETNDMKHSYEEMKDNIHETAEKNVENVKQHVSDATQGVKDVIQGISDKNDDVKKDIKM